MEVYHIPLTQGKSTHVNSEDRDLGRVKWHVTKPGYARRDAGPHAHRQILFLHRMIMERMLGRPLAPGEEVDHIDGNPLNNTRANLRLATHALNMRNRKQHANNRSGYKGVDFDKAAGLWRARIRSHGQERTLGRFPTPEAAAEAYQQAATEQFGEWLRA